MIYRVDVTSFVSTRLPTAPFLIQYGGKVASNCRFHPSIKMSEGRISFISSEKFIEILKFQYLIQLGKGDRHFKLSTPLAFPFCELGCGGHELIVEVKVVTTQFEC